MSTLYVLETGARIEIEHQRLLVTKDDQVLLRMQAAQITQVVALGRVGLTTPAVHELLERGIAVVFLNARGAYLGRLAPAATYNLPLRRAQFLRNEQPDFALGLARQMVVGKLHNQRVQLGRWLRRGSPQNPAVLNRMTALQQAAAQADSLSVLLGLEGSAARLYFDGLQQALGPLWAFETRSRRPPKDPVNSLLSFGYTLLTWCAAAALEIAGLDPYLGYYHAEAYARPALALDLVEEFRAPVVDSLVTGLLKRRQFQLEDFDRDPQTGGVYLNLAARRVFVRAFGHKMQSALKTREIPRPLSYQKHMEVQARKLARLILGESQSYQPLKMR